MKVFFKLFKMYLVSTLNFKNFKAQIQKQKKKKTGETVTKNSTLKIIGMVLLLILLAAEFLLLFGIFLFGLYSGTKEVGNLRLFFEMSVAIISTVTLFFGFMLVSSTYYIGDIEEHLLSMPIKPKTLLAAKVASNSVGSILGSLAFFIILMVIYGLFESPPFVFYILTTIVAILVPLPMIAFSYFVNILVMRFAKVFRNKNLIMTINAMLGIFFAIGFNIIVQTDSNNVTFNQLAEKIALHSETLLDYGKLYPVIKLAGRMLIEPNALSNILFVILFFVVCFVLPALVILFMSKFYTDSLIGFNEKKVKKLESAIVSSFINRKIKQSLPFFTFVKKEFNSMNRNPIFLINGPLGVILMPVIFIVVFVSRGNDLMNLPPSVMSFMQGTTGAVIAGLITGFVGTMANVAQTAVSRDAKFIPFLQSLPINIPQYMFAKFAHAMIFVFVGMLFNIGVMAYIFKFSTMNIVFACLVALPFSALLNLLGLLLDTARPKLHWDNPVAAMKQNMNIFLDMLSNMVILLINGVLVFFSMNSFWWIQAIYFIIMPTAIFIILLKPYAIYAERKISELEI